MTGPCFRCFVGQHDRCEGVAHPLGLPATPCVCDGCGLLVVTPAVALRQHPPVVARRLTGLDGSSRAGATGVARPK
jgi:hypothetical protein